MSCVFSCVSNSLIHVIEFRVFLMFSLLVIDRAISILSKIRWVGYVLGPHVVSIHIIDGWGIQMTDAFLSHDLYSCANKSIQQTNQQTNNAKCSMFNVRCTMFNVRCVQKSNKNIARIANDVQVTICLLVSTSVYWCLLVSTSVY